MRPSTSSRRKEWQPVRLPDWNPDEYRPPTGWDVITAARRLDRHLQVELDRSLNGMGLSFSQYEVMEALDASA